MEKIGILYICTGDYKVFWKDFFITSENFFLNDIEKHYFIFTDDILQFDRDNPRLHLHKIDTLPWPLVTLMRFHYFVSIEKELKDMDYLMFSNSNMVFVTDISKEEFLPRKLEGEDIFVTIHPGYADMKIWEAPFERNPKSTAYVPYNCGKHYVIGAMNGGTKDGFLKMSHILNETIEQDLKYNRIARWHDESHLNRYVIEHPHCRFLHQAYCYPHGMVVSYEKKIDTVGKEQYFDIARYKGTEHSAKDALPKPIVVIGKKVKRTGKRLRYLFDTLLNKRILVQE